ncbi:MAG: type I-C CRISPR-associated protein Cas8c/Csd1, partial [Mucinivorans sp.]
MITELVELGKLVHTTHDALKQEPFSISLFIDNEGRFKDLIVNNDENKQQVLAEKMSRTSDIRARLLLDNYEYVLGVDKKNNKMNDKCNAFIAKLKEYEELDLLKPVFSFYADNDGLGLSAARKAFVNNKKVIKNHQTLNTTFIV